MRKWHAGPVIADPASKVVAGTSEFEVSVTAAVPDGVCGQLVHG